MEVGETILQNKMEDEYVTFKYSEVQKAFEELRKEKIAKESEEMLKELIPMI